MNREDADRWQAIYRDGTVVDEEADDGRLRGWAEVDASQVEFLQICEGDVLAATVAIPVGADPVLFRRRQISIDVNGTEPQETGYITLTVIGWRWPDGGACWLWRGADGGVVMTAGDVKE